MRLKDLLFKAKLPFRRAVYEGMDRYVLSQPAHGDPRDILVIKLDVLGDYILFQAFLPSLKALATRQGGKLVVAANQAVAEFAIEVNRGVVDEFIFLDSRGRFMNRPAYRLGILKQFRRRFAAIYHPTIKRTFEHESLIRISEAPVKVGIAWQERYRRSYFESRADRWYTRLVEVPAFGVFELDRMNRFFEQAAGFTIQPDQFFIQAGDAERPLIERNKPYALVFPGAGFAFRQWPAENFAQVARALKDQYGLDVYVAGGTADHAKGETIASHSEARNICGKGSLKDLPALVAGARIVVANESGPVHLAASVRTPVVCISNGNHFGWWNPYPEAYGFPVRTVYPPDIEANLKNPEVLWKKYGTLSTLPITSVPIEKVLQAMQFLLT